MRSYLIDELSAADLARITGALEARGYESPLDGVYYLPAPLDLLSEEQAAHAGECGPYVLILEAGEDFLRLELLVRGRGKLRCSCIAYAGPVLRELAIGLIDALIRECDIPV
ncbi:MAG: hypothetical protein HQK81_07640 [Desulfovibrionaceae bacterium]|nr:hypothetical protein [Desulfovibrionaceae bacterium]MBF0513922.1 hypothetical protein [Desulfovibrionaceae bacterium]